MDVQDDSKSKPSKEIERLYALIREKDDRLDKLKEAAMRDPRCSVCHYPVAESRLRLCITCSTHVNVDSGGTVTIQDYEEAEKTLMCGSCVMDDSSHADHFTVPYLQAKTKQHLAECISDIEQEFDRDNWKNMFISSASYVFKIIERLRQLKNRQFHSWIEFQRLWNEVNLILWRAKIHHRNIRQAIDVYGKDMRSVLRDLEGLVSPDKRRGAPVGFAPDQVLNYQCSAVAGESGMPSSAAARNVKSGPNYTVKEHEDVKTWLGFRWSPELAEKTSNDSSVHRTSRKRPTETDELVNIDDEIVVCDTVQNKPLGSKKCSALKEIRPQVALSSRSKQVPASTPSLSAFEPVTAKRTRVEAAVTIHSTSSGDSTSQYGVTTTSSVPQVNSLSAAIETIRAANFLPSTPSVSQSPSTPAESYSFVSVCTTGSTVPVWTTPLTARHLVAARNALITPQFDVHPPIFNRVWSAAAALSRSILQPPPYPFTAVIPPMNITASSQALPLAVEPKEVEVRPLSTSAERSLSKIPAVKKGVKTGVTVEDPTSSQLMAKSSKVVGNEVPPVEPLTMSSTMHAEPETEKVSEIFRLLKKSPR